MWFKNLQVYRLSNLSTGIEQFAEGAEGRELRGNFVEVSGGHVVFLFWSRG